MRERKRWVPIVITVVAVLLLLTGTLCYISYRLVPAGERAVMRTWQGATEAELLRDWGPPDPTMSTPATSGNRQWEKMIYYFDPGDTMVERGSAVSWTVTNNTRGGYEFTVDTRGKLGQHSRFFEYLVNLSEFPP